MSETTPPDDNAGASTSSEPVDSAGRALPADSVPATTAVEPVEASDRDEPVEVLVGASPGAAPADGAATAAGNEAPASPGSRSPVGVSGAGRATGDQLSAGSGTPPYGPAGRAQHFTGPLAPVPSPPPRWRLVAYPAGALPAAGISGVVAAATVPVDRPGIGWLLAGFAVTAAVATVHRRAVRRNTSAPERAVHRGRWWAAAALALLAVGTFRAAGWLFVLCLIAAAVCGSLAVVSRPSARGILHDAIAVPLASIGVPAWVFAAQSRTRGGAGTRQWRLAVSVAATLALLAVFVPLLAGADATFAAVVDELVPPMDSGTVTGWIVVFALVGIGTLATLYVLAGPPAPAADRDGSAKRPLARLEWALPVGALTLLFAAFVGAQLVALFGGDDYVQRTAGLTYADYARSGFWQLAAVTLLTLAVILPVLHRAARHTAADRRWLRVLLCTISGLTLVIIASALGRMWTYQQAYGFTVLRLLVGTCELWLGVVYLLVIAAVLRLDTAWLPRTTIATAVAALLTLAASNPEALVASKNIDRLQHGKELDTRYLAGLSADIIPVLDRLPEPMRSDLRRRIAQDLDGDTWNGWNLSRMRAGE